MKAGKRILWMLLLLAAFLVFLQKEESGKEELGWIYGVTIDDSWYEDKTAQEVVNALEALPVKPTVRIVMSKEMEPKEYRTLFKQIHEVAFVMATPVDSYDMAAYQTVESYRKRFFSSYEELNGYVDIWEVGNEINGQGWLGDDPKLIADKMTAAHSLLSKKGAKTALTAYYTPSEGEEDQMREWLKLYVSSSVKEELDYLFVSYYEDDNGGYLPDWSRVFRQLEEDFPGVKLGVGECGCSNLHEEEEVKKRRMRSYYRLPRYTPNYVGGYFWWYWVQDCVPHQENHLWEEFCNLGLQESREKKLP